MSQSMLALEGIRVLEVARTPVASFCTMTLGDFGAEVIKIDPPPKPGRENLAVPNVGEENRPFNAHWHLNRNKKNVVIDLASKEGAGVFLRLARTADVIIEGFRPGVVKEMGIDYESVSKVNPRIVYCSVTGYGQDGPYRDFPGHDLNYIATGGVLGLIGSTQGPPVVPLNVIGDWAGGTMHALSGILIALLARDRTGRGQYVDVSMTDGVISFLNMFSPLYFLAGAVPKHGRSFMNGYFPYYAVYETGDGRYIAIGCHEPWFWDALCHELGRDDLAGNHFKGGHLLGHGDDTDWDAIISELGRIFLTRSSDEWVSLLSPKDIPISKVNDLGEVFSDPHVTHRKMVVEVNDPKAGKVRQIGIAIKLSDTPGSIRNLSPMLGEHTAEILRGAGFTDSELARLRGSRTII